MPSLKELRNRISSVISTKQITSAMKMVSAAKLRKAQDAIVNFRPYANIMEEIIAEVGSNPEDTASSPYFDKRELNKVLIIAVNSNKGLCGSFNSNVLKQARSLAAEKYPDAFQANKVDFFIVGKKVADIFKAKHWTVAHTNHPLVDKPNFNENFGFAESLMKLFTSKEYDSIDFVYNKFKNAAVQTVTIEPFLPFSVPKKSVKKEKYYKNYIFEPGKKEIVEELIPFVLKTKVHKVILDSVASEHGARMTAMHKATDNASDLLNELRLSYNKARQATITKEILEIVSGSNL